MSTELISDQTALMLEQEDGHNANGDFDLVTPGRVYKLRAPNSQIMSFWMREIKDRSAVHQDNLYIDEVHNVISSLEKAKSDGEEVGYSQRLPISLPF